jgi:hypothetical protein
MKTVYKGHTIIKKAGMFWTLGKAYKTEKQAKEAIDAAEGA